MPGANRNAANEAIALALANGKTIKEAAIIAGVSHATVSRRIENKEFCDLVNKFKRRILSEAVAVLASGAADASNKLRLLVNSDDEKVALGASKEIIALTLKARQLEGVERELEEMRERLNMLMAAFAPTPSQPIDDE